MRLVQTLLLIRLWARNVIGIYYSQRPLQFILNEIVKTTFSSLRNAILNTFGSV